MMNESGIESLRRTAIELMIISENTSPLLPNSVVLGIPKRRCAMPALTAADNKMVRSARDPRNRSAAGPTSMRFTRLPYMWVECSWPRQCDQIRR